MHCWLWAEFLALFIALPGFLYMHATRWYAVTALWGGCVYADVILQKSPTYSWKNEWRGKAWPIAQRKIACLRFLLAIAVVIFLTEWLAPTRLLVFPMQRPFFWLLVMGLYPIVSALPQEFLFRSFFFHRYEQLFPARWIMIFASASCFGLVHIMFHNWISPILAALAGLFFADSYDRHRSLKWAAFEHAAYGCMIFTIGIGSYFVLGPVR
jgi:membrane protease YdiL (CAAX protease family)